MHLLMEQTGYTVTGEMKMEKEKQKKRIIRAAVFLLIAALIAVWWLMPIRILKGYRPEDITRIDIEGIPGGMLSVTDETEVRTIAENLYTCGAVKDGISYMRMGYGYALDLYVGEKRIRRFCINSSDSARDSVFFYKPKRGDLAYNRAYLDELAEKYEKKD